MSSNRSTGPPSCGPSRSFSPRPRRGTEGTWPSPRRGRPHRRPFCGCASPWLLGPGWRALRMPHRRLRMPPQQLCPAPEPRADKMPHRGSFRRASFLPPSRSWPSSTAWPRTPRTSSASPLSMRWAEAPRRPFRKASSPAAQPFPARLGVPVRPWRRAEATGEVSACFGAPPLTPVARQRPPCLTLYTSQCRVRVPSARAVLHRPAGSSSRPRPLGRPLWW